MRRLFRSYPRTSIYIISMILVYALLVVFIVNYAWQHYFLGGEPLSADVLANPSLEKIAAERARFLRDYWIFCLISLGGALVFYFLFNWVCLLNYEGFRLYRSQWRTSHILSYMGPILAWWHLKFSFSGLLQKLSNGLFVAFIIITIFQWLGAYIKGCLSWITEEGRESHTLSVLFRVVIAAEVIANILAAVWNFNIFMSTWNVIVGFFNFSDLLLDVDPMATYRIVILPQGLMALIPLLPLFMLIVWCRFCLPKALGAGPNSYAQTPFICMEKKPNIRIERQG